MTNTEIQKDWDLEQPLIIGGMGGSGTRLVAEICRCLGYYLGDDLNRALDHLPYTLLFRRQGWFYKSNAAKRDFSVGFSLHEKMYFKQKIIDFKELWFMLYATMDMSIHYRNDWTWPFARLRHFLSTSSPQADQHTGWGWKEPNTYLLLEELGSYYPRIKFIHTLRHGLDMAFSSNQRQLKAWGELFNIPYDVAQTESPDASLRFWVKANQHINQIGKRLDEKHYLAISFDRLCQDPEKGIDDIISFLGIHPNPAQIERARKIPKIPASMGRFRDHDLKRFDQELLAAVEQFGFQI